MSAPRARVLLATTNHGKLAELRALLADLPADLLSLRDVLPDRPPPVESGETLEENALIKARAAALATGILTLAEDAGLEVDALGGRPGVRSARFAGEHASDADNNATLLAELERVDEGHRTARFRCVLVLIDPSGRGLPRAAENGIDHRAVSQGRGAAAPSLPRQPAPPTESEPP